MRAVNRLILFDILCAVVLVVLVSWGELSAGKSPPPVPPIEERAGWTINQIPANLTVVYKNGLQVAYPILSSTSFNYEETFKEQRGLWYFHAPCTSYQKVVRPTPIAWRWGETHEWQPYIQKTW